jgi:hypothetical protein
MGEAMALRKRYVYVWIAAAGLLLASGLTAVLLTAHGNLKSASHGNPSSAEFSSAQLTRLERGLDAQGLAAQAIVLADSIRSQVVSRGRPFLPSGSRVHIEAATFEVRSPETATVDAMVTGPMPGKWLLLLVRQGGNWQLIGTRNMS